VFEKLFRSKSKPVGKLATDLDPEQPYLSGLLLRFDEVHSKAISSITKLNPSYSPPPIPEGLSESERGGFAASSLAMCLVVEAMGKQGKGITEGDEELILNGAIAISYGMFILMLLSGYLKDDGVEIDSKRLGYLPSRFAELFVWLDDAKRKEMAKKGLEIFKEMSESNHPKIKEWHDTLSKIVRLWLISGTSDKRTKDHDEDFKTMFSSHLGALYNAVV
jgi:hypothetical protein